MANQRRIWSGVVLIVVGFAILMREWLTPPLVVGIVFTGLGIVGLKKRLAQQAHSGVFAPLLAILIGIYCILGSYLLPLFSIRSHLAFGTLLVGIALLITSGFIQWRAEVFILGIMFTAMGTLFVLRYFHVIYSNELIYLVDTYWPVLLIVGGIALLLNGISRRQNHLLH